MANKPKARLDQKGRNPDKIGADARVMICRRSIWHGPQIGASSVTARAIVFELLSMHNGTNNGSIFLSVRDATDRLGLSSYYPVCNAFRELETLGLITNTLAASFNTKTGEGSLARAWRLNWVKDDGKLAGPEILRPLDFSTLSAKAKKRLKVRQAALERYTKERLEGNFAVVDSTTDSTRAVVEITTTPLKDVVESTTAAPENGGNPFASDVVNSTTHILHHTPSANGAANEPVDPIRATVRDWWRVSDKSERLKLAKQNGLAIGELLAFVEGTGNLPFPKAVAVRASVTTASAAA